MTWGRKQSSPKISKNQLLPCLYSSQRSLFSLSLPAASSAFENPTKTFLLHQQTVSQPPHEPKSSPAIGAATARSSLSPLQIFFFCFFFFLPPPQAANTATISSTSTFADFTPGQWQQFLLLYKVASHFTSPSATAKLHAERELTIHVLQIYHSLLESSQLRLGPAPKKRKKIYWAKIGPAFCGLRLVKLAGPVQPSPTHKFNII